MSESGELRLDKLPAKELGEYIHARTEIHAEMVRRLIASSDEAPLALGEILEDVANTYLDIADEISALARTWRQSIRYVR